MTVPQCFKGLCVALFLVLALVSAPLMARADTPARQKLFHIERSKNANIVQYDAQIGADGKLLEKKPVVAYWVRLAEQGQVEKLSWIQSKFVYGFDARFDSSGDTVELDMEADVGRKITVIRDGDTYRATLMIDGSLSYFEKMFVNADRKGWSITVYYVELYGEDMETGEARYEKFIP